MRHLIKTLFLSLCFISCKHVNNDYSYHILEHRKNIDDLFSDRKSSPLSDEDLSNFNGLPYYDVDKLYLVPARIEKFDSTPVIQMSHTANRIYPFIKWGKAHFQINNDSCHLTIYLSTYKDSTNNNVLFIPFKDETNGKETYAGGRYLDLEISPGNAFLDFNLAYNPDCAYSDNWSCPIVPKENTLRVSIRAGSKIFARAH